MFIISIGIKKLDPKNILLCGNDSLYIRDYFDSKIVFIRNDLNRYLEKFILLHELGHALLHTDIFKAAFNIDFVNKDKLEKQANYFAFKMLNIEFDKIDLEGMSLEQISRYVGVPYKPLCQLMKL